MSLTIHTQLTQHLLEKVLLSIGGVRHLPTLRQRQRQLLGHIEGLVADMRVVVSGARSAQRRRQLQGRGGRVRADMHRLRAGRVAARVRTGLPRVGARVWLLKKRLGQMLVPPGAGLRIHDGVK